MKFISILTQGLCVSILTACGSGSSDIDTVESFNLSPYEGRVVSSDSLVGTWVYVKKGTASVGSFVDGSSFDSHQTSSYKEYFIIRETETGLKKSDCSSGFSWIELDADKLYFEQGHAVTVTNNNAFSGLYEIDDVYGNANTGYYITEHKTVQGIKISNSVKPFGTVTNTTSGVTSITEDIYCFAQEHAAGEALSSIPDEGASGNFNSNQIMGGLEEFSDPEFRFAEWTGFKPLILIEVGMNSYYSTAGATVNLTINEESYLTYSMNYSGSNGQNGAQDVSGSIQIQLPTQ